MDNNQSAFKTQSLILSATLLCQDTLLESIEKDTSGKSTFNFTRTEKLNQITKSFWDRSLLVEPNALWEQLRYLKSRIYGG